MRRARTRIDRFLRADSGVAATEFAVILPVLLFMLLAFYDAVTALAIYTKTRYATAALAELTNQYTTIHDSDLATIVGATASVLAPYSSSPASVSISQVAISSSGSATVSWSNTLAAGSSFSLASGLAVPGSYLIYCKVSYVFTPVFGLLTSAPITLSDSIFVSPRNSASIMRTSP